MGSAQIKAILVIVLLFGGLAFYLTGGIDFKLPEMPSLKELFSSSDKSPKKKNTTKAKPSARVGKVIDSYKNVNVYYNGNVGNVSGRHTTKDGYNLGLKYQCVEFGKRFYYEAYGHKMPDSYGHAKDFFDLALPQGAFNKTRGMYQFINGGTEKPRPDDLVIIGGSARNQFGHLFIVTKVTSTAVEFIQQNPGASNPSRGRYKLLNAGGQYTIDGKDIVGWLRMG